MNGLIYVKRNDCLLDPVTDCHYAWKLVVPKDWQPQVLQENHCEAWTGHLGVEKTIDRIQRDYYWIGMHQDIRDFVRSCTLCQQYKSVQTGQQGLMNRRFLDAPWLTISADIMEFTTSRRGFKYLLVIQDLFTKWIELCALRKANGKAIARALEDLVLFR